MGNSIAMEEIGDHAIASNLNFAIYRGTSSYGSNIDQWINTVKEKWGEHFIGIHYSDEPGGRMLDQSTTFRHTMFVKDGVASVSKSQYDGSIQWNFDGTTFRYYPNGIFRDYPNGTITNSIYNTVTYHPNGTIEVSIDYKGVITENIKEYALLQQFSYKQISGQNNIASYDDAVKLFDESQKREDGSSQLPVNGTTFTYYPDCIIRNHINIDVKYYPNGTASATLGYNDDGTTIENITEYTLLHRFSYEQLLAQNPLRSYDDAAELFVDSIAT